MYMVAAAANGEAATRAFCQTKVSVSANQNDVEMLLFSCYENQSGDFSLISVILRFMADTVGAFCRS